VLLLIVPAFLAQSQTDFTYGFGEQPESIRSGKDIAIIDEAFGKNSQLVALVPRGDVAREERVVQSLEDLPHVTSVLAYVNAVGAVIPDEFLEESMIESFYSENYSRFIIQTNTDLEGERAFTTLERIQVLLEEN